MTGTDFCQKDRQITNLIKKMCKNQINLWYLVYQLSKRRNPLIDKYNEKKLLYDRASQHGIMLTGAQVDSFCLFMGLLSEWNSKINLVGTDDRERIINELLLDSMIPAPYLPEKGNLVDLGSGAGFPALILKIIRPGLEVKLVESNGKKVSFLKFAIRSLHLTGITAINKRIEFLTDDIKAWGCDMVTSRAMADLEKVIRLSSHFLGPGGIIVGFLGKGGCNEIINIRELLSEYHLEIQKTISYDLPEKKSERTIVLLKKMSSQDI